MPCNCRTPYPSSVLHAENPLASISKQMPQQGLKPLPHRSLTEKLSKRKAPLLLLKARHAGCGTPPGGVRVLSNSHHAPLYHVRPFRRPQVHCSLAGGALGRPPRGRQGWPTPESWDDGDLTRKCNWKSPTFWGIHMLTAKRGSYVCKTLAAG